MLADLEVIQIIHTNLLRRGDGKKEVVRIVEQYWRMDGTLLFEIDPCGDAPYVCPNCGNRRKERTGYCEACHHEGA